MSNHTTTCDVKDWYINRCPNGWLVLAVNDEIKMEAKWGPFDSKEEAYKVSGMPRPKTEAEELWELVVITDKIMNDLRGGWLPDPFAISSYGTKIAELKTKWKKWSPRVRVRDRGI